MPRLKFTKDVTTKEAKPRSFAKDQVVEFADDEHGQASAQHWLSRGAAVDLDEEEAKDQPPRLRAGEVKVGPVPAATSEGDKGAQQEQGTQQGQGPPARSGGFGTPVKGADKPGPVVGESKDAHQGAPPAAEGKKGK